MGSSRTAQREEDGHDRRRLEEHPVGPNRHEVFLGQHLDRVGERVEEPEEPQAEDRGAVGTDAILHDRGLLALDPGEDPAQVQHEAHDEGDPGEGDPEIDHEGAHAGPAATLAP